MDWSDVSSHLTGLAHLATADPAGHPAVAVVSPMVEAGDIWFQTRSTSTKARNLRHRADLALMWQAAGEAYVWGTADLTADAEERRRLWDRWPYDATSFFGGPDHPDLVLVRVRPERATVMGVHDGLPQRRVWRA